MQRRLYRGVGEGPLETLRLGRRRMWFHFHLNRIALTAISIIAERSFGRLCNNGNENDKVYVSGG